MSVLLCIPSTFFCFFFFNDTATTEIYTLSLHDALPILSCARAFTSPTFPNGKRWAARTENFSARFVPRRAWSKRSEEHTSELQSQSNLVCRLLLEKKNKAESHHNAVPISAIHLHIRY